MTNILYLHDSFYYTEPYDTKQEDIDRIMGALKPFLPHITFKDVEIGGDYDQTIRPEVEWADVVILDYGGIPVIGMGGLIDSVNKYFEFLIKEHPSKEWWCVSLIDTFDWDVQEQLEQIGVKFMPSPQMKTLAVKYFNSIGVKK